jgi:hypothetical protein
MLDLATSSWSFCIETPEKFSNNSVRPVRTEDILVQIFQIFVANKLCIHFTFIFRYTANSFILVLLIFGETVARF